jgi:hypothetical protein
LLFKFGFFGGVWFASYLLNNGFEVFVVCKGFAFFDVMYEPKQRNGYGVRIAFAGGVAKRFRVGYVAEERKRSVVVIFFNLMHNTCACN